MPTPITEERLIAYCENCAARLPLNMVGKRCPKCELVNLIEFESLPKRQYAVKKPVYKKRLSAVQSDISGFEELMTENKRELHIP